MRVLVISSVSPVPPRSGGQVRVYNLIRRAGRRHQVHLACVVTPDEQQHGCDVEGLDAPAELVAVRRNFTLRQKLTEALHPRFWARTARRRLQRLAGRPLAVVRQHHPEMRRCLRRALRRTSFDVVQMEYTSMGQYLPLVRRLAPRARLVLDEIDVSYVPLERRAAATTGRESRRSATEAHRMKRFEYRLWPRCDAVIVASESERRRVCPIIPAQRVWVVPNGVDTRQYAFHPAVQEGARLLFLGYLHHPPNVEGLRFFCRKILPEVRRQAPGATLEVVGGGGEPADLDALRKTDGVVLHGYVPDIRDVMRGCRAMVVPLLSGGGTRLKILEAFAAGLPVVSTTIGSEGIGARDGQEIVLADAASEFAQGVLSLLADCGRAQDIARRARTLVEERYDWDAIAQRLDEVWTDAAEL